MLSLAIFAGLMTTDALGESAKPTLKVPSIFADHMILQRGKSVPVWGWASPGAKVTVRFAGQSPSASADKHGRWVVKLSALEASNEGRTLAIAAGEETLELKDVLVGEVWLCSGQSNMAYTMGRAGDHMPAGFDASKYPTIRQFLAPNIKKLQQVDPVKVGEWSVCSPETVKEFTAVGFFFARELSRELEVPIGLLNCSKGSTRVEAWTTPGVMYRCKILPLGPQAIRGAIWYQGEHNAGGPDGYAEKLEGLIAGWRKDFDQGDFPFYIVQLPNFCQPNPDPAGGDGWARIREEQAAPPPRRPTPDWRSLSTPASSTTPTRTTRWTSAIGWRGGAGQGLWPKGPRLPRPGLHEDDASKATRPS